AAAADAWAECARALKEHDEAKIRGWKEEIDTHLVFAGLFSAILTAFNVEAYKLLLPQDQSSSLSSDDLLRALLVTMAQGQVLNFTSLAADISASMSSTGNGGPNFKAALINGFWFCSLICSLAAASISIMVKQWLNQYATGMDSVSPEIARLRQFRYDNLRKWKVAEIMMLLPILLQGALVLFLVGLILFLWPLRMGVAIVAGVLVALLLLFIIITAILPTFMDHCAYQSPQAWGVFVIVQGLKKPLRIAMRSLASYANRLATPHADGWKARERILIDDKDASLDQHMLVGADRTFLDDTFLRNVVEPCLADMAPEAAAQCYYEIVANRADRVDRGVHYFDESRSSRAESLAILTDITLATLENLKTRSRDVSQDHPIRILRTLEPLLVRSLPLTYCHFCRVLLSLLGDRDRTVRHLAFSILYQQLSRNVDIAAQHAAEGCQGASPPANYP
ncbi:hypothetical protein C8Q74DRAFT_1187781, partial [Fomes fomentarius]